MSIDTSVTIDFTPAMRGTMQTTTDADGIRATTADAVSGVDNVKYMTAFQVKNAVQAINTLPATNVTVTPVGGISATNAQSAFAELDSEKANALNPNFTGTATFVNQNTSGTATFQNGVTFQGTVTFSAPQTFTNVRINPRITTIASATTITPDSDANDVYAVTALAANLAIANPSGTPVDGQRLTIRIRDNGTARTLSWGSQYSAINSELWATTLINKTMIWVLMWNISQTKWDVVSANPMPGAWGA